MFLSRTESEGHGYVRRVLENIKNKKMYFLTPGLLETEYVDPSPASGLYHSADPPEQTRDLGEKIFYKKC